ncbi:MAG: hypothetical protein JJ902_23280 [Roseibium sp.]|nr:hypothetical protein [Roseibium sp.]
MTVFYDWPAAVRLNSILVYPSGALEAGRLSRAEFDNSVRIPGGRNIARATFATMGPDTLNWFHWFAGRIAGNIIRLPLHQSGQVADTAELQAAEPQYPTGIPFSNTQPFSTGYGFQFSPTGDVLTAVQKGDVTVTADLSRWPGALTFGKVFGLGYGVHHVQDIAYTGSVADIAFSPPARRDILAGEALRLRPSLLCKAIDPNSFMEPVKHARLASPGPMVLREVIDDSLL